MRFWVLLLQAQIKEDTIISTCGAVFTNTSEIICEQMLLICVRSDAWTCTVVVSGEHYSRLQ